MKKISILATFVLLLFAGVTLTPSLASASMKVNSSVASINAVKSLNETLQKLNKTFVRLSDGLKQSSSSDDAAGLGVAESMNADLAPIQRERDTVSVALTISQRAEAAVRSVGGILRRMRQLAQKSSGTLSDEDYDTLSEEFSDAKDNLAGSVERYDGKSDEDTMVDHTLPPGVARSTDLLSSHLHHVIDLVQDLSLEDVDPDNGGAAEHIKILDTALAEVALASGEFSRSMGEFSRNVEGTIRKAEIRIRTLELSRRKALQGKAKIRTK